MPVRSKLHFIESLFQRHTRELLAFAGLRAGTDMAEDLVQDAYLRLLQHPDPESLENPRAYLYRITGNLGINQFHHNRVRGVDSGHEPLDPDLLTSPGPGPDRQAESALALERFLAVLGELPQPCQDAFILHKLEGLTYPQIAQALGISTKSAQRYVDKAWLHCLAKLER